MTEQLDRLRQAMGALIDAARSCVDALEDVEHEALAAERDRAREFTGTAGPRDRLEAFVRDVRLTDLDATVAVQQNEIGILHDRLARVEKRLLEQST